MGQIIDFEKRRAEREVKLWVGPHISGPIRCLACKSEWIGIMPAGTLTLECPECGCQKAVLNGIVSPPPGSSFLVCSCENERFMILEDGTIFCDVCGDSLKD